MAGRLDVGQAVRDADDRLAAVGHLPEQLHHLAVGLLVEPGGHLVEEQQARAGHQLVGQAGPLDLAAAQVADQRLPPLGQADDVRGCRRRSSRPRPRDRSGGSRSSAVYRRAAPTARESCSTSFWGTTAMSCLRASKWAYRSSPLTVHRPGVGRVPAAQDRQQRRLARAARAEQADELPGADRPG